MASSNKPHPKGRRLLDKELARRRLEELWDEEIREGVDSAPIAGDEKIMAHVSVLMASETVSFPYALLTQLLGKVTDRRLDALCLQKGDDSSDSRWDPRSLAKDVVVPWVQTNENVLGTSTDPYVSNSLRRPFVSPAPPNVQKATLPLWESFHAVLSDVEEHADPDYTLAVFRAVLREVKTRLVRQQITYPALPRVSLEQVLSLVGALLVHSQEGEHAMSVVAALCVEAGKRLRLWDEVKRQVSTASDKSTGMAGDLECWSEERLVCVVEVKERSVTLADVQSFESKLSLAGATEAIIVAPKFDPSEIDEIKRRLRLMWGRGINLYHLTIDEFVSVTMSLIGEDGRRGFIVAIGEQLDAYARPSGRMAWRNLLTDVLNGV